MASENSMLLLDQLQAMLNSLDNQPSSAQEIFRDKLTSLKNTLEVHFTAQSSVRGADLALFHEFILDNINQAFYYQKDNKTEWYGSLKKILGYEITDFNGMSIEDFSHLIHEEDQSDYITMHHKSTNGENAFKQVFRIQHKQGHYIFIEDTGNYSMLDGSVIIKGALTDITNKIVSEQLLEAKDRGNKMLHDISLINSNGLSSDEMTKECLAVICKYTNWSVARALVFFQEKFDIKPIHSIWYTSDSKKFKEFENRPTEKQITINALQLEVLESKKATWTNKNEIPAYEAYKSILDETGLENIIIFPVLIKGQVAVIIEFYSNYSAISDDLMPDLLDQLGLLIGNILERKTIEEELDKFSMAIDQNFASVVITNTAGYIEYVNPRFTEETGYSKEEVLGKKPSLLRSGIHNNLYYKDLWSNISSGKIWQGEICNKKKDGSLFWEQCNISPMKERDGNISHYVAVKIDITEKKKWEEELKIAKESAEFADKAKSEFLAGMSHEIRTPMNAILGFAELLAVKITDEKQSSYLDSIRSSGKTLLNLINDVLDLSKMEAGMMKISSEFFDPYHMFKDVEYMFSLKAQEKGLDFKVEVDMNMPVGLETDEIRLRQILINLIGNAIKFTDYGFVKVSAKSVHKNFIGTDEFVDIYIDVADSGIGISNEFRQVLFTPFTQQEGQDNRRYGGTGLGLTITKRLVQLLNGTISVASIPTRGSIFSIVITGVKASSKIQNNNAMLTITPERIKFKPSVIILADDVENNRKYFKGVLDNTGIEIIESENGKMTIELAKKHKPDAIITDIKMPGIDGFELLKRIKEIPELSHIPVVATTASASVEDKSKLLMHNFNGILIKPIKINDVYLELMRLLPHEIIETEDPVIDGDLISGDDENIAIKAMNDEHIYTVKRMLETDLFTIWKSFEDQQPLSEVELFGQKCKELGQKYDLVILVSYGNRLLSSINNFDIDTMLKSLDEYPKLLSTFKTIN